MSISFDKSLRLPKVAPELAVNMFSETKQNPCLSICPTWTGKDMYGRPASYFSTHAETSGCHNPSQRIFIENSLRPSYDVYQNQSFGSDLLGVRRKEAFGMVPQSQIANPCALMATSNLSCNAQNMQFSQEQQRIASVAQKRNRYDRFSSSGM